MVSAAIAEILTQTTRWICEKYGAAYNALPEDVRTALHAAKSHHTASAVMNEAAASGNLAQTKTACRAYIGYWKQAVADAQVAQQQKDHDGVLQKTAS